MRRPIHARRRLSQVGQRLRKQLLHRLRMDEGLLRMLRLLDGRRGLAHVWQGLRLVRLVFVRLEGHGGGGLWLRWFAETGDPHVVRRSERSGVLRVVGVLGDVIRHEATHSILGERPFQEAPRLRRRRCLRPGRW